MNALLSAAVALVVIGAAVPLAARPARRPSDLRSLDPTRPSSMPHRTMPHRTMPHSTSPHSTSPDDTSPRASASGATTPPARRSPPAVAARGLTAVAALVAGASIIGPAGVFAMALVTLIARTARRRRHQHRQQALFDALVPELIDLVLVGVHAGLTTPQAMLRLAQFAPPALRPALAAVESRVRGGERFADALQVLSDQAGPSYRALVFTLALAERAGDPIASVLDRLADEARRHRRRLADASARELPVRLAVPLVSCTLPAFVLLTIAPVLAGALSSLRGSLP